MSTPDSTTDDSTGRGFSHVREAVERVLVEHGWLMDDTTPDEVLRARLKSAAFMIYALRGRLGDWEDVASAQAAALREAADEWSEWESFRASDGHMSLREHGKSPDQWLRERAATYTTTEGNES